MPLQRRAVAAARCHCCARLPRPAAAVTERSRYAPPPTVGLAENPTELSVFALRNGFLSRSSETRAHVGTRHMASLKPTDVRVVEESRWDTHKTLKSEIDWQLTRNGVRVELLFANVGSAVKRREKRSRVLVYVT